MFALVLEKTPGVASAVIVPYGATGEWRRALKNEGFRESHAAETSAAGVSAVLDPKEAHHRYRLLATMVQGTAAALPEAWHSYRTVGEARTGAQEMLHNHRVLRVAIVEDRVPPQFVEWVGR
jgi:hypothetical protein